MIILEKLYFSIEYIVWKWKINDSLILDLVWKLSLLLILEDFSKRNVKQFKRRFKNSLKNAEIMFEMELTQFFIIYDLELLRKYKWTKRRRRISQFKVTLMLI
jgi:hypothetical protein